MVRSDGTLDLYEDIQSKITIEYKRRRRRFVVRAGGWIGYLPLNDRYALRIETRVPIANLERVIARSANTNVDVLGRYSYSYGATSDKAQSLYDVMAEQFLTALALIWREGLAKTYRRYEYESCTPFGRMDTYRTAIGTRKAGQPRGCFRCVLAYT